MTSGVMEVSRRLLDHSHHSHSRFVDCLLLILGRWYGTGWEGQPVGRRASNPGPGVFTARVGRVVEGASENLTVGKRADRRDRLHAWKECHELHRCFLKSLPLPLNTTCLLVQSQIHCSPPSLSKLGNVTPLEDGKVPYLWYRQLL